MRTLFYMDDIIAAAQQASGHLSSAQQVREFKNKILQSFEQSAAMQVE